MKKHTALLFAFVLFMAPSISSAGNRPSKGQIMKDLKKSGVKKVKLTSNGKTTYDRVGLVYRFQQHAVVTREYKKLKGVDVEVIGWVEYHKPRKGGKWTYYKFAVAENRYTGIPDPTEKEILAVVSKDWPKFYGYHFNKIVSEVDGPKLKKDHANFNWHTPNSVSFLLWTKYEESVSNTKLETVEQYYEVRFYRTDIKAPWNNFISTGKTGRIRTEDQLEFRKVLSSREISSAEMRDLPTLGSRRANSAAKAELASLPQIKLPQFNNAAQLFLFAHNILRNGDPQQLRAFLLRTLSPFFFQAGGTVLNPRGEQVIKSAIAAAYQQPGKYKDQYCQNPRVDKRRTTATRMYIIGAGQRMITSMAAQLDGGRYENGVKTGRAWKFTEFAPRTKQDRDTLDFVASFTDRKKLCPDD